MNQPDTKVKAVMGMKSGPIKLDVILFESKNGMWSAQCLQYDIAAQADSFHGILYEFERVVISNVALSHELGRKPFEGMKEAPQEFWQLYESASTNVTKTPSPFRVDDYSPLIPQMDMRVAEQCMA